MLFEDGQLMSSILTTGFVPFASQLLFQFYYNALYDQFSVQMLYNWQETPIPGACNDQLRCDYATFVQFLQESSLSQEQYTLTCGDTPK